MSKFKNNLSVPIIYIDNVWNNTILSDRCCFSIFIKLLIQLFEVGYFPISIGFWIHEWFKYLSRAQNLTIIPRISDKHLILSWKLKKKKKSLRVCVCVFPVKVGEGLGRSRWVRNKQNSFQSELSYAKIQPTASFDGFINPWKWEITVELLTDA